MKGRLMRVLFTRFEDEAAGIVMVCWWGYERVVSCGE